MRKLAQVAVVWECALREGGQEATARALAEWLNGSDAVRQFEAVPR